MYYKRRHLTKKYLTAKIISQPTKILKQYLFHSKQLFFRLLSLVHVCRLKGVTEGDFLKMVDIASGSSFLLCVGIPTQETVSVIYFEAVIRKVFGTHKYLCPLWQESFFPAHSYKPFLNREINVSRKFHVIRYLFLYLLELCLSKKELHKQAF